MDDTHSTDGQPDSVCVSVCVCVYVCVWPVPTLLPPSRTESALETVSLRLSWHETPPTFCARAARARARANY